MHTPAQLPSCTGALPMDDEVHLPIEYIRHNDQDIAIIISHQFDQQGIRFFTPHEYSQQLAYMHHPSGKTIIPHTHNELIREVHHTLEVLFIRKGKLKVDFYSNDKTFLKSRVVLAGDVVFLASGGHGFEVLEEVEMFEVKQGPHLEGKDKTRFESPSAHNSHENISKNSSVSSLPENR